jgi:hypothetical protein
MSIADFLKNINAAKNLLKIILKDTLKKLGAKYTIIQGGVSFGDFLIKK